MSKASRQWNAELDNLPEILTWVRHQLDATNLGDTEKKLVEVALEEAVVNVILHGTKEGPVKLLLSCRMEKGKEISFELADTAPPFNPLTQKPPKRESEDIETIEEGKAGMILMHKCMDLLLYRRENEQNILTLTKNL